jgi:hypothetical protein
MSAIKDEIELIVADAERRAAPLRAKLQRLQIADEELRDLDPDQAALPLGVAPAIPQAGDLDDAKKKRPIRSLIEEELTASTLPLSKAEFMERFKANGYEPQDSTVGSTLSRLVGEGVLEKDGTNRYRLRPPTVPPTHVTLGETEDGL